MPATPTPTPTPSLSSSRLPLSRYALARLLWCGPFGVMLTLLVVEALLSAATTWLVIQAGRDVINDEFLVKDLGLILGCQVTSYIVGAVSWVFAEQAGFGAFGRYMHRFAQFNKGRTLLLGDKDARATAEPFLTNEVFHIFFELMYELESALKLFLLLIFNAIVFGVEIDAGLPVAYALVFAVCMGLQYGMRKRVSAVYLANQRFTNRMTAQTYTAWDNILSGNQYNYRVWNRVFKARLREALKAQINAIMLREGLSSAAGVVSLVIIFATISLIALQNRDDPAILIALAATLPRQIDLAHSMLSLSEGWNDLIAIWARIGGAVEHFSPTPDAGYTKRIKYGALKLTQSVPDNKSTVPMAAKDMGALLATLPAMSRGRINVRGGNGAGKSSLLAWLKSELGSQAYFWPTTDRLAFEFSQAAASQSPDERDDDAEEEDETPIAKRLGFSAGEWQIATLQEIVAKTNARYYFLDEWDANLDAANKAKAEALIEQLAARAVVVEISHRDAVAR